MRKRILFSLLSLLTLSFSSKAQEVLTEVADTLFVEAADSTTSALLVLAEKELPEVTMNFEKEAFKPNPTKALLWAIIPGMGQIYNRKYWKLPIVYGGLMGCLYAITWNNRNYVDYREAYFGFVSSDPATNNSWVDFMPESIAPEDIAEYPSKNPSRAQDLKRRKDYFRRNRDLSLIVTAGIQLLFMLDAYVDAQLFDFDISPDLSMRVEPTYMPKTTYSSNSFGVNCSFTF